MQTSRHALRRLEAGDGDDADLAGVFLALLTLLGLAVRVIAAFAGRATVAEAPRFTAAFFADAADAAGGAGLADAAGFATGAGFAGGAGFAT